MPDQTNTRNRRKRKVIFFINSKLDLTNCTQLSFSDSSTSYSDKEEKLKFKESEFLTFPHGCTTPTIVEVL